MASSVRSTIGSVTRSPAGVGDEDVDPTEVVDRAVDDRLARLPLLDVAGDEVHAIPGVEFGERALGLGRIAAVHDDECSLVEEPLRDAETDASRPTGDTGNAPVQYSHDNPLMPLGRAVRSGTVQRRRCAQESEMPDSGASPHSDGGVSKSPRNTILIEVIARW